MTRRLAREEGIFAGISSGGGLAAALRCAREVRGRGDRAHRLRPRRPLPLHRRLPGLSHGRRSSSSTSRPSPTSRGCAASGTSAAERERRRRVVDLVSQRRRQATGNDFLPPHLQRVVAISCALREQRRRARLVARHARRTTSATLVQRFFDGIEQVHAAARLVERRRLRPAGAALPRALPRRRRRAATGTWATTTATSSATTTSAASTCATLDLMDVLAGYQNRALGAARRDRAALRAARQARHGRLAGVAGVPARRDRRRSATTARPTSPTPTCSTCASS